MELGHTKKLRLGILISGRGSNMAAIARACLDQTFPAEVACVISANSDAGGLAIAARMGIKTFVVERRPLDLAGIDKILRDQSVDLVCLAGFMSILTEDFVNKWKDKIINIHPSLLPSFKGLRAQKQALDAGVKIAGCTVHYVYPELDAGPVIMQAAVPVLEDDDVQSLAARILEAEHICYPEVIRLLALEKIKLLECGKVSGDGAKLHLFNAC